MSDPQQLIAKWRKQAGEREVTARDREQSARYADAALYDGFSAAYYECAQELEAVLSAETVPQSDLEPIKARETAATRGPWRSMAAGNCQMEDGRLAAIAEVEGLPRPWNPVWVGWQNAKNYFKTFLRQADAEFIAHARQDIPTLVAEVERLRSAGTVPSPLKSVHDLSSGKLLAQFYDHDYFERVMRALKDTKHDDPARVGPLTADADAIVSREPLTADDNRRTHELAARFGWPVVLRTIFVDDRRYEFNAQFITGASIAALTNSHDRVILLEDHAQPNYRDWQVYPANGSRAFELFGGEHFYTHPKSSYVR